MASNNRSYSAAFPLRLALLQSRACCGRYAYLESV